MEGSPQVDLAHHRMIVWGTNLRNLAFIQPFPINENSPALRRYFRLSCHASAAPNPHKSNAATHAEVPFPFSIQQHWLAHPPTHRVLRRIAPPSPLAELAALPHYRTCLPISESSRARNNAGAPAPSPPSPAPEFLGSSQAPLRALPPTHEHRRSTANAFSMSAPASQTTHQASRP